MELVAVRDGKWRQLKRTAKEGESMLLVHIWTEVHTFCMRCGSLMRIWVLSLMSVRFPVLVFLL